MYSTREGCTSGRVSGELSLESVASLGAGESESDVEMGVFTKDSV